MYLQYNLYYKDTRGPLLHHRVYNIQVEEHYTDLVEAQKHYDLRREGHTIVFTHRDLEGVQTAEGSCGGYSQQCSSLLD